MLDKVQNVIDTINKNKPYVKNESQTILSLIYPFITHLLGYDVYNPLEIRQEFTADVGTKNGEKVDLAIFKNNEPIILIECKSVITDIDNDNKHYNQLFRYFTSTYSAKFAILTNGIKYKLYTDIENENIMDSEPFLKFDLLDDSSIFQEYTLQCISMLHKENFESYQFKNMILKNLQSELIKNYLINEFNNPSEDFIRFILKSANVYDSKITYKVTCDYADTVKTILNNLLHLPVANDITSVIAKKTHEEVFFNSTLLESDLYFHNNSIPMLSIDNNQIKIDSWNNLGIYIFCFVWSKLNYEDKETLTSGSFLKQLKILPNYIPDNNNYTQLDANYKILNQSSSYEWYSRISIFIDLVKQHCHQDFKTNIKLIY